MRACMCVYVHSGMDLDANIIDVHVGVDIDTHKHTQTHTHTGEHAGPNTSGDGEDAASSIDWCSVRASVRSYSNEINLVHRRILVCVCVFASTCAQ